MRAFWGNWSTVLAGQPTSEPEVRGCRASCAGRLASDAGRGGGWQESSSQGPSQLVKMKMSILQPAKPEF